MIKRPKTTGPVFCIYCNNSCNAETDEFIVTKRKTVRYFHRNCYYKYKTIGFNLVDKEKENENI